MISHNNLVATQSRLAVLTQSQLHQEAQMHKGNPYMLSLIMSEQNRRNAVRTALTAAQAPQVEPPKVVDQAVASMAPQDTGIAMAAPPDLDYADGGIVGYAAGDVVQGTTPPIGLVDRLGALFGPGTPRALTPEEQMRQMEIMERQRAQFLPPEQKAQWEQAQALKRQQAEQERQSSLMQAERQRAGLSDIQLRTPSGVPTAEEYQAGLDAAAKAKAEEQAGLDAAAKAKAEEQAGLDAAAKAKAEEQPGAPRTFASLLNAAPTDVTQLLRSAKLFSDEFEKDYKKPETTTFEKELPEVEARLKAAGYDPTLVQQGLDEVARVRTERKEDAQRQFYMSLVKAGAAIASTPGPTLSAILKGGGVWADAMSAELKDLRAAERQFAADERALKVAQNDFALRKSDAAQGRVDKAQARFDKAQDDLHKRHFELGKTLFEQSETTRRTMISAKAQLETAGIYAGARGDTETKQRLNALKALQDKLTSEWNTLQKTALMPASKARLAQLKPELEQVRKELKQLGGVESEAPGEKFGVSPEAALAELKRREEMRRQGSGS